MSLGSALLVLPLRPRLRTTILRDTSYTFTSSSIASSQPSACPRTGFFTGLLVWSKASRSSSGSS